MAIAAPSQAVIAQTHEEATAAIANPTERNIRCLYAEMVFAAAMGGIATFNAAFAVRLGASPLAVSILSAAPALLTVMLGLPSGRFLSQRRAQHKSWAIGSLFINRLGYALIALLPLLVPANSAWWLVGCLIAFSIPLSFFDAGWNSLVADVVSASLLTQVLSRRNMIWALGTVIVSSLAGLWLSSAPFPMNYQVMYGAGFLMTLGSHYFLTRLVVPASHPFPDVEQIPQKLVKTTPTMRRLLLNTILYQIAWTLPMSLFPFYFIHVLHVSDSWLGLYGATASAGVVIGYGLWERLSRQCGLMWVNKWAGLFTWILPCVVLVTTNLWLILVAACISSLASSGMELSNLNLALQFAVPEERPVHVSRYVTAVNLGMFIGPLSGAGLCSMAGASGLALVFALATICRLASGLLCTFNPVSKEG